MAAFTHQAPSSLKTEVGSTGSSASTAGGFTADLPVDAYGLVLDYLGLFKRALP
jgi:hypothetical protein